ncbi:MAG: ribose-5-phosphate isomerase RpiA [Gemmatimonadota bacterium]
MDAERQKAIVAESALLRVDSGMRLGLGTGSTADLFLRALGGALRDGRLSDIAGVPTSERTERVCHEEGIPLVTLESNPVLDLAVDGADEVDSDLQLIKGLGGALLREKMIVQAARAFLVMVDETKRVSRLGERCPLPVEVVPFMHGAHDRFLRGLGAEPRLRLGSDGTAYRTDNGNVILDCHFTSGISDPAALDRALQARAGVVETGLFVGLATEVHIARGDAVEILRRGHA